MSPTVRQCGRPIRRIVVTCITSGRQRAPEACDKDGDALSRNGSGNLAMISLIKTGWKLLEAGRAERSGARARFAAAKSETVASSALQP